jgi:hypothetical protein
MVQGTCVWQLEIIVDVSNHLPIMCNTLSRSFGCTIPWWTHTHIYTHIYTHTHTHTQLCLYNLKDTCLFHS